MKVFSFCLYGTEANYYTGFLENCKTIREWFPDFTIVLYKGICDPSWTIPEDVQVVETGKEGAINALYRYVSLQTADIGFVRDADSRVTERDRWCIETFLHSPYSYHIIRDHTWHRSRIMAGLFGWKKPMQVSLPLDTDASYGYDEAILNSHVYPHVVSDALVHTNLYALVGEHAERITHPMADPTDFLGNVIWNGSPKFTYTVNVHEHVLLAQQHDQFALMDFLLDTIEDPLQVPLYQRELLFMAGYLANYYLGNIPKAQQWLARFEFAHINSHLYANANYLLPKLGKKVVAVFDATLTPAEDEVFVYYGNYPDSFLALPWSNRIYRHASKFWDIHHDEVRYHPSWEPIEVLYVMNLEERFDRWCDILTTLCAVQAPLHRIHHYKAQRDGTPVYAAATKNHVDVIRNFCASGKSIGLCLEDDFVFVDDRETVWNTLSALWTHAKVYTILFVSMSKLGNRIPHDSLLTECKTECTTSSGYILRKETAATVLETVEEGYRKILETNDGRYCIDRYWTKLPDLFVTRPKLGFQRPSYSNILRTVSANLD